MGKPKSPQQKKQERLVIVAALVTICISVLSTLWFSGVISLPQRQTEEYKNITLTESLILCEKEAREAYGDRLKSLTTDDHSNRFDPKSHQYKIFFTAVMSTRKTDSGIGDFYINCFVNASRGKLETFDLYEDKNVPTEAQRKGGRGLFGWPL